MTLVALRLFDPKFETKIKRSSHNPTTPFFTLTEVIFQLLISECSRYFIPHCGLPTQGIFRTLLFCQAPEKVVFFACGMVPQSMQ